MVTAAILQAANLTDEESSEDTVCPNTQQNIVVVSTPHPDHADRYARIRSIHVNGVNHEVNAYETAAEHTTKGVIRGIPLTETPQQIHNKIVTARNPTALAAKRIASTTTVIIAFDGLDVPYQVRYGSTLLPCSLYRKQIDICYQCGRLGHRMDVCPYPNNKICRGCGVRNPPPTITVTLSARSVVVPISPRTKAVPLDIKPRTSSASVSENDEQPAKPPINKPAPPPSAPEPGHAPAHRQGGAVPAPELHLDPGNNAQDPGLHRLHASHLPTTAR